MTEEDPTDATNDEEEERPQITDDEFLQAVETLDRVERSVDELVDAIGELDTGLTHTDTVALLYGRRNGLNKTTIEDAFETLDDITAKSTRELTIKLLARYSDLGVKEAEEFLSEVETLRNRYSDDGGA